MELKNYMEVSVNHFLPSVLQDFPDICKCDHCILDIKALALNNLKPWYMVTHRGAVFSKLSEMNTQYQADVIQALLAAIEIVSNNPKHDMDGDQD